jgi:hypothetical protein
MSDFLNAVWSMTPTVLVGLIFWLVMFVILRADKHERRSYANIEAEERAKMIAAGQLPAQKDITTPKR